MLMLAYESQCIACGNPYVFLRYTISVVTGIVPINILSTVRLRMWIRFMHNCSANTGRNARKLERQLECFSKRPVFYRIPDKKMCTTRKHGKVDFYIIQWILPGTLLYRFGSSECPYWFICEECVLLSAF